MLVQNIFQPFEIEYKELSDCPVEDHRHTFFELIYILKGTGIQYVNQHALNYYPENLFLVAPQDVHHFEVTSPTGFLFVRFSDIYLDGQKGKDGPHDLGGWIQKMEYIFQNNTHMAGCIIRELNDKPLVRALFEAIMREYVNQRNFHREILQQIINTIITVVARNISLSLPEIRPGTNSQDLVNYIHQHIYFPEKLTVSHIAVHFNLSPNYVSEYFKKQTGKSLQQYITSYKLKLVETRLQYSSMRINEIVAELGFTDESHLNRVFKKYKGLSPSLFRRQSQLSRA